MYGELHPATVVVGGDGTYDVRGRLDSDDDDLPEGDDDRDERRIVVTLAPGADAAAPGAGPATGRGKGWGACGSGW